MRYVLLFLIFMTTVVAAPSDFTTTGNVGIGTTNPQYTVDVNGTVQTDSFEFADGTTQNTGVTPRAGEGYVSTAVNIRNVTISGQDANPYGLFFKPDGTRMYLLGDDGNDVNEYSLSFPWNVSSASFVSAQSLNTANPVGLYFRQDGLKMYIAEQSTGGIEEYTLSQAWNSSTISYVQHFDTTGEESFPSDVYFHSSGEYMYIVGPVSQAITTYELSTSWDISTASYKQSLDISTEESSPQGVFFRTDGRVAYIVGDTGNDLSQYHLNTPWNISGGVFVGSFTIEEASPTDMYVSPDVTKAYVIGYGNGKVLEYDLGLVTLGQVGIGVEDPGEMFDIAGNVATDTLNASEVCISGSCLSDFSIEYGFMKIDADQTLTTSADELGNGVAETTAVGGGVTWDSSNNEFDIATSGVYEIIVSANIECSGGDSFNFYIQVNGSTSVSQATYCHPNGDPVGRKIILVDSLGIGATIDAEIDSVAFTTMGWETGSGMTVKKIG